MKINLLLLLLILTAFDSKAFASTVAFDVYPLCTNDGTITCPFGYEAACDDKIPYNTEPKCVFLDKKYIPGCWKFIGIKHLDFSLLPKDMPPTTMIKVTGGGEIYTLNREIIGCKKL